MTSADRVALRRGVATRTLAVAVLAATGLLSAVPLPASAAVASTDLSVTLTNTPASPGKRVSYHVVVHNNGSHTARRVRVNLTTSAAMRSIRYKIHNGYCSRSPKQTTCYWNESVKPGGVTAVTISGVLSKKLRKGTPVTNSVAVMSATHLVGKADDVAADNYRLGMPRVVAPLVAPAPRTSPNPQSKLVKINDTAARVFGYSHDAVKITLIVLACAVLWFALGLTLRRRKNHRHEWEDVEEPMADTELMRPPAP